MMNLSAPTVGAVSSDPLATAAFVVAVLAFLATAWQAYVAHRQLSGVRADVQELQEVRRGKLYKLKRAVASLYDACQNIPAPPEVDRDETLGFNLGRLSAVEASCDTFFFGEINAVPGLRNLLEQLDQAAQDAQDDVIAASKAGAALTREELISVADQLRTVYRLAGECDQLLAKVD
jgi:hypothetical protein